MTFRKEKAKSLNKNLILNKEREKIKLKYQKRLRDNLILDKCQLANQDLTIGLIDI